MICYACGTNIIIDWVLEGYGVTYHYCSKCFRKVQKMQDPSSSQKE